MIIFCEECGARNVLDEDSFEDHLYTFECCECSTCLMVAKPTDENPEFVVSTGRPPMQSGGGAKGPIKVLIVDDSNLLRNVMKEMLAKDDQLQIVGEAENGLRAIELIQERKPDVVTLDVNMPVMDGLTTIKHIMIKCPTLVVMLSTLTGQGSHETFEALRYGAVDYLQKPSSLAKDDFKSQHELIVSRVKNAARAGIKAIRYLRPVQVTERNDRTDSRNCEHVFAINTTYGGYGALLGLIPEIDPSLQASFLSVIYATPSNVDAFARYLEEHSSLAVKRAVDGQGMVSGTCYLASAYEDISVKKEADGVFIGLQVKDSCESQQASNRLMTSLAEAFKDRASAILLSSLGEDGLSGAGRILNSGGTIIVQDPRTCLCKETNQLAIERYGLSAVRPGNEMIDAIRSCCAAAG